MYDPKKDLADYLDSNEKPDAGVVRALTGAIERSKTAPAEPGFIPPAVNSGPERSTQQFLSDELRDEMSRRAKIDADAYLAQPKFSSEAEAERRQKIFGRYQLGIAGSTKINGDTP
jgi:hypothetical protein